MLKKVSLISDLKLKPAEIICLYIICKSILLLFINLILLKFVQFHNCLSLIILCNIVLHVRNKSNQICSLQSEFNISLKTKTCAVYQ